MRRVFETLQGLTLEAGEFTWKALEVEIGEKNYPKKLTWRVSKNNFISRYVEYLSPKRHSMVQGVMVSTSL